MLVPPQGQGVLRRNTRGLPSRENWYSFKGDLLNLQELNLQPDHISKNINKAEKSKYMSWKPQNGILITFTITRWPSWLQKQMCKRITKDTDKHRKSSYCIVMQSLQPEKRLHMHIHQNYYYYIEKYTDNCDTNKEGKENNQCWGQTTAY